MSSCIRVDTTHVYLLRVEADDGQTYALPTAHLESVILGPNVTTPGPAPKEAMPERALLRFTDWEVEVRGSGLAHFLEHLSLNNLTILRVMPPRCMHREGVAPLVWSIRVRPLSDS